MNTYAEAAGDTPRAATVPARISSGGTLITLLRREFWEHRYLWLVPLILAGLLALCAIFGHGRWSFDRQDPDIGFWTSPDQRIALGTIVQWVLAVPLYLVTLFMVSYYAARLPVRRAQGPQHPLLEVLAGVGSAHGRR